MIENRFTDEFIVHVISSASMEIFDSNNLSLFQIFFTDEIQLAGDWRIAFSEIILPFVINGNVSIKRVQRKPEKGYRSQCYLLSKNYNGKKFSIVTGT